MTYDSQESLEKRRAQLERELARVDDRIGMLASIPDEPVFDDGEPTVIWFKRKYNRGNRHLYTWCAIRIESGKWYLSGTGNAQIFDGWTAFYQWIQEYGEVDIWTATEWEPV